MTDDSVRANAMGLPVPGQGHHDGEQSGLHDVHPGQSAAVVKHLVQVPRNVRGQGIRALGERLGEDR